MTAGDYLDGFLLGTRRALFENDRESITITVPRVDARTVGALIALFERAVGFYASLVGINAYHQPGVEAGKKAAAAVLALQAKVVAALSADPRAAEQIAVTAGSPDEIEAVYSISMHLAANGRAKVSDEIAREADVPTQWLTMPWPSCGQRIPECFGLANPKCKTSWTRGRSPRNIAAASSQRPGKTSLRVMPSGSALSGS